MTAKKTSRPAKAKAARKAAARKVPKGKTPDNRKKRISAIQQALEPHKGRIVTNIHDGRKIVITHHGIDETAHHASKGYHSTLAAIDAPNQLKQARFTKTDTAKHDRARVKQMGIDTMHIGKGRHNGGKTKVIIGTTSEGVNKLYCVTSKRDKPHKKKEEWQVIFYRP